MNKKTVIIILILMFTSCSIAYTDTSDIDNQVESTKDSIINEQLQNLKIDELQRMIIDINNSTKEYFPEINLKKLIKSITSGEDVLSGQRILNGVSRLIFDEVINNLDLLAKLLVLCIICAILHNMQNAFEQDTVGQLAHYICYIIIISIIIKSFILGMNIGRDSIDQMVVFMQALLPILITLLAAMGGLTSSALFQPLILGSIGVISTIMKDVILPLVFFSVIINIVSKISDKIQISKLSSLIRQISFVIIGVTLTIFMGIISIQGVAASGVDGVTIRTAKFAIDTFIPIVGSFLSEAMDTVVGCSMLLKNAVGIIGLIALFLICIMPGVKIISLVFVYKLISAIIEPISDERVVECLNEVGKSLTMVFATVISVGLMFFIAITIIVGAGNITVMLR